MIDVYNNEAKDYPITLFTVTYNGVSINYELGNDANLPYFGQWDWFNREPLSKDEYALVRSIDSTSSQFAYTNKTQIKQEGGTFYDFLVKLRQTIKQSFPDAVVSEIAVNSENYQWFPMGATILDDSETLEQIHAGYFQSKAEF